MRRVLGRSTGDGPTADVGCFLARDSSDGGSVGVDLDRPHAAAVVGKRGSGKSHTLGVLAEEIIATDGVTAVVLDPMGGFGALEDAGARIVEDPCVDPSTIGPRAWCQLLDLDPTGAVGGLVWQAATAADGPSTMQSHVENADAADAARRAAANHLDLATAWNVFESDGIDGETLRREPSIVLDLSGLDRAPACAVVATATAGVYQAATDADSGPLPWLLIDEVHAVGTGPATAPLRTVLTRGRHPGVSTVLATQRPSALPEVAISQADLLIAHHLTATTDLTALEAARPSYIRGDVGDHLPSEPGTALLIDDTTETVCTVRVRNRRTTHKGDTPTVTKRNTGEG